MEYGTPNATKVSCDNAIVANRFGQRSAIFRSRLTKPLNVLTIVSENLLINVLQNVLHKRSAERSQNVSENVLINVLQNVLRNAIESESRSKNRTSLIALSHDTFVAFGVP